MWSLLLLPLFACSNDDDTDTDTGGGESDTEVVDTDSDSDSETDTGIDSETDTSDTVDTEDSVDTSDPDDTVDTGDPDDTVDTSDTVDTGDTSDTVDTSDPGDACVPSSDPLLLDFTDLGVLSLSGTPDLQIDDSSGVATVPAMFTMRPLGGGLDGDWEPPAGSSIVSGGTPKWQNVRFGVARGGAASSVTVDGDLDLNIPGDFAMGDGDLLFVKGALDVTVGGRIALDAANIYARDGITIHHHGTEPAVLATMSNPDGSYIQTARTGFAATGGEPLLHTGDIVVWSRGGVVLGNNTYINSGRPVASDVTATSGDVEFRTYGDILSGESCYIGSGDGGSGTAGSIWTWAEGQATLGPSTWWFGDDGPAGSAPLRFYAVGGLLIDESARMQPTEGGSLDVRSEGLIEIRSNLDAQRPVIAGLPGPSVTLRAGALTLTHYGFLAAHDASAGGSEGGDVSIDVLGDVSVGRADADDYAGIFAGDAGCGTGGDVQIRAGGDVHVASGEITAGTVLDGTCSSPVSGRVLIEAGGTITEDLSFSYGINEGDGSPTPPSGRVEGADVGATVAAAVAEHDVWRWGEIALAAPQTCRTALAAVQVTNAEGEVRVEIRQPGGAWQPASELVGLPLQDGWELRLRLKQRQFDGARADGLELSFQ